MFRIRNSFVGNDGLQLIMSLSPAQIQRLDQMLPGIKVDVANYPPAFSCDTNLHYPGLERQSIVHTGHIRDGDSQRRGGVSIFISN